ncbi:MAG TPA: SDR family oxidoreductase, partial [Planctomycetes bacterium]|nr:SDR family oxidoreductase [Planctomycetota bacterium]
MQSEGKLDLLVFDASELASPSALEAVHEFFSPRMRRVATHGRVIVLGQRPETCSDAAHAAAQSGLSGLARSLAKELGRKTGYAHLLRLPSEGCDGLEGALHFFASEHSSFVTGRVVDLEAAPAAQLQGALQGKRVLVTGAGRGIGKATAARLAREGAKVMLLDRPDDLALVEAAAAENVAHRDVEQGRGVGGDLLHFVVTAFPRAHGLDHAVGIAMVDHRHRVEELGEHHGAQLEIAHVQGQCDHTLALGVGAEPVRFALLEGEERVGVRVGLGRAEQLDEEPGEVGQHRDGEGASLEGRRVGAEQVCSVVEERCPHARNEAEHHACCDAALPEDKRQREQEDLDPRREHEERHQRTEQERHREILRRER